MPISQLQFAEMYATKATNTNINDNAMRDILRVAYLSGEDLVEAADDFTTITQFFAENCFYHVHKVKPASNEIITTTYGNPLL